jgi:hypothetical protein
MCFARAADHLQTSLSAALAPLQLKKPPTPACLSRAKREKEACKHTFSKQTSYPQKKNRYSSRRATTTSKTKQTKSSNSNEIPTRESKTVSNKLQLQTQKHNPRKNAIQMFSSGHKRMAKRQRESKDRRRQRESREETSETASERESVER